MKSPSRSQTSGFVGHTAEDWRAYSPDMATMSSRRDSSSAASSFVGFGQSGSSAGHWLPSTRPWACPKNPIR